MHQISAAIMAYARIDMFPYISREDCYYTDTDSIVIKSPLPEEDVSPTVLGKLKFEKKRLIANNYNYLSHIIFHLLNILTHILKHIFIILSCNRFLSITPPCMFEIYLIEPFVCEWLFLFISSHIVVSIFYTNNNINNILIMIEIVIYIWVTFIFFIII